MNGIGHKRVEVPPGVQCFVGEEARHRRAIEERVVAVFEGWDYAEIIPPLYDYADVFAERALTPRTYSFVGRDGNLLALRPDFTSLIAKLAAGRLAHEPAPLRLYYSGEVLRYEPPRAGRQSELHQMGLEQLGGERGRADAEVLAIAAECLETLGIEGWVLTLGHAGLFEGIVAACDLAPEASETLRERAAARDPVGLRAALARAGVAAATADGVCDVLTRAGDASLLAPARERLAFAPRAQAALDELEALVAALAAAELAGHLSLDLGEVRGLDYYTGLVFRAFAPGLGFEVASGGRYDALGARFGRPLPAVGFMLGLDRVALLLERQGRRFAPARPAAAAVSAAAAGTALAEARRRRAAGERIRFGREEGT